MRITDSARISGYGRIDLSLTTSPAQTAAFNLGIYDVWSTVDVYLKVGVTANDVTVAAGSNAGYLLIANNVIPFSIEQGERIGAVVASGTGTLSIHRVG